MPQSLQDGNIVEFRSEDRPYNIKRAKNIKVLRKKILSDEREKVK